MIKVLAVVDTLNWCFGSRAEALRRYQPEDIQIDITPYTQNGQGQARFDSIPWHQYDVIFVLPTHIITQVASVLRMANVTVPLVASHNSGLGRRHHMLLESLLVCDYVVVNNYATWFNSKLMLPPNRYTACNISNGVDLGIFNVQTPIEDRAERVLWTGSAEKATGEEDIKGMRLVLEPLSRIASHYGFESDYRVAFPGQGFNQLQMAEWYNTGRYVVCASSSEGTPNFVLEAVACGCVPVTLPVGNVPELFKDGHSASIYLDRQTGAAWNALKRARELYNVLQPNAVKAIQSWDWSRRAIHFYELFRALADGERPAAFSYIEDES